MVDSKLRSHRDISRLPYAASTAIIGRTSILSQVSHLPQHPAQSQATTPARFWDAARARNQLWRTLIGFILVQAGFFGALYLFVVGGAALLGINRFSVLDAGGPATTAILFLAFLGYYIGLWFTLKVLHNRPFRTLLGAVGRVNWKHFRGGFLVALLIAAIGILIQIVREAAFADVSSFELRQSLSYETWGMLLLPALLLIFVQIFAEELVFRGYLLQQLRSRFQSIWIWAVLPSLAFGLMHADTSTYGTTNAFFFVLHTTVAGIVLSVLTVRTGNIGAAAGLHFGNNAQLLIKGNEGTLDGFSLFLVSVDLRSSEVGRSILEQTLLLVVVFVVWWLLTQRRRPIANAGKAD